MGDYKQELLDYENELINKLNNREKLSGSDIRELIWGFGEHERIQGDDRRWSRTNKSIIEMGGKLWSVYWEEGLTECQDNEFGAQIAVEVVQKTRMIEQKYYEVVK
jgi:hypothetical protein